MDNTSIVFCGRTFSREDIEMIIWARKRYPKLSRSELAGTDCEILKWTTPAGRAKMKQCKDLFDRLEADGIVQLPPIKPSLQRKQRVHIPEIKFNTDEISGDIRNYEPMQLVIAEPGEELKRWRSYVNQYHMLGDKWVFGSRLHYFVKSGDKELGCLQFSASAWSLEDRDQWIGWTKEDRKVRLHLIVNNSRFLIFPWVHIRNLASKALSLAVKQIQQDWLREYCYAPVLLETFVDTDHFNGTCYKASNWIYLGETKGSGRTRVESEPLSKKMIFMYPLQENFKACLKGEEHYKVVNPE